MRRKNKFAEGAYGDALDELFAVATDPRVPVKIAGYAARLCALLADNPGQDGPQQFAHLLLDRIEESDHTAAACARLRKQLVTRKLPPEAVDASFWE